MAFFFFKTCVSISSFCAFLVSKKICYAIFIIWITDLKYVQFLKKFRLCFPWKDKSDCSWIFFKRIIIFYNFNSRLQFYICCMPKKKRERENYLFWCRGEEKLTFYLTGRVQNKFSLRAFSVKVKQVCFLSICQLLFQKSQNSSTMHFEGFANS